MHSVRTSDHYNFTKNRVCLMEWSRLKKTKQHVSGIIGIKNCFKNHQHQFQWYLESSLIRRLFRHETFFIIRCGLLKSLHFDTYIITITMLITMVLIIERVIKDFSSTFGSWKATLYLLELQFHMSNQTTSLIEPLQFVLSDLFAAEENILNMYHH